MGAHLVDTALLRSAIIARRFPDQTSLARDEDHDLCRTLRAKSDFRPQILSCEFEITEEFGKQEDSWHRCYTAFYNHSLVGELDQPGDWETLFSMFAAAANDLDREALLQPICSLYSSRGHLPDDKARLCLLVSGHAKAETFVQKRLNQPPYVQTESEKRYKRTQAKWARESAARAKAVRASWSKFRAAVTADPDGQFAGKQREKSVNILLQWLRARSTEHGHLGQANWRDVRQALGDRIGDHFEQALRDFWRDRAPPLRSTRLEKDHNTIFGSQTIGLTGLFVEIGTSPDWPRALSHAQATRAAEWSTVDLSGAPEWIDALLERWPSLVEQVLAREIRAELGVRCVAPHPHVLSGVQYGSDRLKRLMAPTCVALLDEWPEPPTDAHALATFAENIDRVLSVVTATGGSDARLGATCEQRFHEEYALPSGTVWLRAIFAFGADRGVAALEARLESIEESIRLAHGASWLAALFGERRRSSPLPIDSDAGEIIRLTRLAYRCVRREDDIAHDGAYTPDERDDAQDARNRLVSMLIEKPGPEAYSGLMALSREPIFSHMPDRLRLLARQRAANDSEPGAWSPSQVVDWEHRHALPPTSPAELHVLIGDRLDDYSFNMREHDFNVRATLAKITDEAEMQPHIAMELYRSQGADYQLEREPESADKKKSDVRVIARSFSGKGVVEIKVGDNDYSVNSLKLTLKNQILGQYLRHPDCRVGYLLITYAGGKSYNHPDNGKPIQIEEVVSILSAYAKQLEAESDDGVRLGVKLLDLRTPLTKSA